MDNEELDLTHNDSTPNFPAIKNALQLIRLEHSYSPGCGCDGLSKLSVKSLDDIIEVLEGYY